MYLSRKVYIREKERLGLKKAGIKNINPEKVNYIIEEAGYWRKANAIHQWFVDNVQDGNDDCKDYEVYSDKMEELVETCKKVIKASKLVKGKILMSTTYTQGKETKNFEDGLVIKDPKVAKELLPCQEGFFFGGTDYDEYYLNDLKYTIEVLEKALKDTSADYEYHSSW